MARQGNSKRLILHRTHWYIIHNGMRVELAQICRSWLLSQNEWPYHIFGVFWCGVGCLQFNTIKTIQYTHGLGKVWLCLQPFRIDELAICINFQKFATVMPVSVMLIQYNSKTWGEKYWTTEKWGEQKKKRRQKRLLEQANLDQVGRSMLLLSSSKQEQELYIILPYLPIMQSTRTATTSASDPWVRSNPSVDSKKEWPADDVMTSNSFHSKRAQWLTD